VILLNAGAAIYVSGKAKNIEEGVRLAEEAVANEAAMKALESFVRTTRHLAGVGGTV
jgi:anthranilate phosphoribosyltransferase